MPYNPEDSPRTRNPLPEPPTKDSGAATQQPQPEADSRPTTASRMQLEGPLRATAVMPAAPQSLSLIHI
eukprot:7602588-Alexandrium_andersonii.AAC.1